MRDITPGKRDHFESIYKYVPEDLLDRWMLVPVVYYEQDDVTMTTLLRPSEPERLLRKRFQNLVQGRGEAESTARISIYEWCVGICVEPYLIKILDGERGTKFLAWCSIPEPSYDSRVESLVTKAYARFEEILAIPFQKDVTDKEGNTERVMDKDAMTLFMQAYRMLDMRAKGQYTQRVEQKTMQVTGSMKDAAVLAGMSVEELDKQIAKLEKQGAGLLTEPEVSEVIDVRAK